MYTEEETEVCRMYLHIRLNHHDCTVHNTHDCLQQATGSCRTWAATRINYDHG